MTPHIEILPFLTVHFFPFLFKKATAEYQDRTFSNFDFLSRIPYLAPSTIRRNIKLYAWGDRSPYRKGVEIQPGDPELPRIIMRNCRVRNGMRESRLRSELRLEMKVPVRRLLTYNSQKYISFWLRETVLREKIKLRGEEKKVTWVRVPWEFNKACDKIKIFYISDRLGNFLDWHLERIVIFTFRVTSYFIPLIIITLCYNNCMFINFIINFCRTRSYK